MRKVYSRAEGGAHWSAIQITTASAICAALDLVREGRLPQRGFVRQEDIALEDFLANRFGRNYAEPEADCVSRIVTTSRSANGPLLAEVALAAAGAAQIRPLEQRLQHQMQRALVDVDAEALVEAVAEMDIFVRQPVGIEASRIGQAAARPSSPSSSRPPSASSPCLTVRARARAGGDDAVGERDPRHHRRDRIEAHRLEHIAGEQGVVPVARRLPARRPAPSGRRSNCSIACGTTIGGCGGPPTIMPISAVRISTSE